MRSQHFCWCIPRTCRRTCHNLSRSFALEYSWRWPSRSQTCRELTSSSPSVLLANIFWFLGDTFRCFRSCCRSCRFPFSWSRQQQEVSVSGVTLVRGWYHMRRCRFFESTFSKLSHSLTSATSNRIRYSLRRRWADLNGLYFARQSLGGKSC